MKIKFLVDALKFYNFKSLTPRISDGHNNDGDSNDANDRGTHDSIFVRLTPNSYVDGIGQMPAQESGTNAAGLDTLPAPRAVSNAVMAQGTEDIPNSFGVNEFFQFFGQAITHDVAEAATGASGDPPIFVAGLPFPITRTPYEDGTTATGTRQQINEETSFLDLSMVYGNSKELTDLVRADLPGHAGQSAKLLVGAAGVLPTIKEVATDSGLTSLQVLGEFRPEGFGGLPDPALPATQNNPGSFENLFFAGDNRVNQTPQLITQQTLWVLEHNYQVEKLTPYAKLYGWSQDQLFEAARAVTEAEWQHVVYDEYLPKLVGEHALSEYRGYQKTVDPSIINEWTTVAFRFGHDQSSQTQKPLNEDGSVANPGGLFTTFTLSEAFLAGADGARTSENIDQWLRGALAAHTQEIDGLVVDGNRNTLFGIGANGAPITADLEVFDIQRARDHGVWNYNELRAGLGLSEYSSFDEFGAANNIDPARLQALKTVYGNDINKLDSIIGGLLEEKYYDSQLGETFTKLTVMQFEALRDGDKLYYENHFKNNPLALAEIEHTSLADIIARNSGIDHLYHDAFAAHNRISDSDRSIDGTDQNDLAIGGDLADIIRAGLGDDDVYAGKGNDVVLAGGGRDLLWGEDGRDTFVFGQGSGRDVVKDFDARYDKLDLTDYGLDSWREVKSQVKMTSQGVTIKLDNESTIELTGVKKVAANNFVYDHDSDYGVA
jgi:peroxidase